MTQEQFAIYTTTGSATLAFVAKGQSTRAWWIMPSCADGWAQRREWAAAPALGKATERDENLSMTNPRMAEMSLGIPRTLVAPGLTRRLMAALTALEATHG